MTLATLDMLSTCMYVINMPKMIQLRHVPDDLHRTLKARAALEGLSLSDYLLREIRRVAERPTLTDLRQRLSARAPVIPRVPPAKAVRQERDRR
jgi:antitoxin FitA